MYVLSRNDENFDFNYVSILRISKKFINFFNFFFNKK